ncbi:MAG TPA: hypothetical protein PKC05_03380 [Candidatus Saccharibacteria bacterium]|nr:hypothetical protein [Candidatus Saccharibacteria bacterium]
MEYTKDQIWDYLIYNEIASKETLITVTNINGYNIETLNDVLYSATGYRDIEQLESEKE